MSFIEKMLRRYTGGMGGGHHGRSRHGGGYYEDRGYPGNPVGSGQGMAALSCPQCRASNPPGARFCAQCGTALAANCTQCGAALTAGVKFCPNCGRAVGVP